MGNKWTVLSFLLVIFVSSLPLLNALPANPLIVSQPATLFVEEDGDYYVYFATTNESGVDIPLTPSQDKASCAYIGENSSFVFEYNTSMQTYELSLQYPNAANYSFDVTCTADNIDTINSMENLVQEVLPALTSIYTSVSTSSSIATLQVAYNLQPMRDIEGRSLTPDDNAQCNASIYKNETDELVLETSLEYIDANFQATVELDPDAYYWNVSCSAEPNFEPASGFSVNDFRIMLPLSSLSISYPTTLFTEETGTYLATYTTLPNESGGVTPLTPSQDNASCNYLYDDEILAMDFNTTSQNYELTLSYPAAENYSFSITCNSTSYESAETDLITQEVLPAPTSFSTLISTSDTTATLSVTYISEITGKSLSPENNSAQCNASIYENDTDELALETSLDYLGGDYNYFLANVELDSGTAYYWNVSCSAEPNFESVSSFSENDFYIDEESCQEVEVTSDLNVSESKTCSSSGGSEPLYSIIADNVTLNCNGATLTGIGSNGGRIAITASGVSNVNILNCNADGFSWPIWAADSNNVSFINLSVSNSGNGINVISSNNTVVNNFTFTNGAMVGAPALYIAGGENNTFSNGLVSNYDIALFSRLVTTTRITNVTVENSYIGFMDAGGTTLTNALFNNTYLALVLAGSGSLLQNVSIYNSPFSTDLETTVAINSNNTVADIAVYNSTRDAVWLGGVNNSLALSASSVNGTALNLIEGINNSINLTLLLNNVLDINITDSANTLYGNVFNGSFSRLFFNVTNSTQWQEIALFYNISVPNTNSTSIYYNKLALYNDTGLLNITNLTNAFTLANNSVSLNSTQIPFLNVSAEITFTGVSYANNSVYEILRDGVVCRSPDCAVKINANPVSFGVFGFSNYSTRLIPKNTTTQTQAATTAPASGGGGGGGGSASPAAQIAVQNTTANATTQTPTSNQTASQARTNQTQQPQQNEQDTVEPANTPQSAQPSPLTGLFAGIPKELNIYTASAGVAVIALLGVSYLYFFKKH